MSGRSPARAATCADLKRFGLALPGAELFVFRDQPGLSVKRKTFALWYPPDKRAILKLDRDHQMMLFEVRPEAFTPCKVGTGGVWSYVEIAKLTKPELKALVLEAWTQIVPKKVSRLLSLGPTKRGRRERG